MAAFATPNSATFKPAILIPVYNHEHAIDVTLEEVLQYGYPVLLVDDGSSQTCQTVLENLAEQYKDSGVALLRLPENRGKGGAVKAGLRELNSYGFSHALQVDADGQHNLTDIPMMFETAQKSPKSLIAGYPVYDESVPKHRYYGRYLTHVWVWINTLSLTIKDSMCGFRVYPVQASCALIQRHSCGDRMEFDTEILVRWVWRDGKVVNLPTQVHYPVDGVSHFDKLRDNVLISAMHTRLFFGMLCHAPALLKRKLRVGRKLRG